MPLLVHLKNSENIVYGKFLDRLASHVVFMFFIDLIILLISILFQNKYMIFQKVLL